MRFTSSMKRWWIGVIAVLVLAGCGGVPSTEVQVSGPRLRVTNTGAQPLERVVVIFPQDRITFGPVAPGATTEYQPVPGGVYGYAAYEIVVDGQTFNQPVLDWVGAAPLPGAAWTYRLSVDATRPQFQQIQNEVQQE